MPISGGGPQANPPGFQTMTSIAQQKRKISIGNRGPINQQVQQI